MLRRPTFRLAVVTDTAPAEHATLGGRGTRPAALASPPVGEVGPCSHSSPTPTRSPHIGGGLGWEILAERAALEGLQAALTAQAGGTTIPMILRDGLIGPWPWLHIARPDNPHVAIGVVRMIGTAWVLLGPHGRPAERVPICLGPFPTAGEDTDYTALARAIISGLARGVWPVPGTKHYVPAMDPPTHGRHGAHGEPTGPRHGVSASATPS